MKEMIKKFKELPVVLQVVIGLAIWLPTLFIGGFIFLWFLAMTLPDVTPEEVQASKDSLEAVKQLKKEEYELQKQKESEAKKEEKAKPKKKDKDAISDDVEIADKTAYLYLKLGIGRELKVKSMDEFFEKCLFKGEVFDEDTFTLNTKVCGKPTQYTAHREIIGNARIGIDATGKTLNDVSAIMEGKEPGVFKTVVVRLGTPGNREYVIGNGQTIHAYINSKGEIHMIDYEGNVHYEGNYNDLKKGTIKVDKFRKVG